MALPKFLICDDGVDRAFVLHTSTPVGLYEFDEEGNGTGHSIAPEDMRVFIETEMAAGRDPAKTLADIVHEAGEYYIAALAVIDEEEED